MPKKLDKKEEDSAPEKAEDEVSNAEHEADPKDASEDKAEGAAKKPSQEVLERALARVNEEQASVRALMTNHRRQWVKWYSLYRKFRDQTSSTYNRVFIPKVFEQIERIAPRLTAHDPVYNLIPITNDAITYAEVASEWLMYVWDVKNLRRETRLMAKGSLIYGTQIVKLDIERITNIHLS